MNNYYSRTDSRQSAEKDSWFLVLGAGTATICMGAGCTGFALALTGHNASAVALFIGSALMAFAAMECFQRMRR